MKSLVNPEFVQTSSSGGPSHKLHSHFTRLARPAFGVAVLLNCLVTQGAAGASFSNVTALLMARGHHTATLLSNGKLLVAGGETTVTVRGQGKGGRNQELALAAASGLRGMRDVLLASIGTDGNDGPTDAAGAFVDGSTLERAAALGLDPLQSLANNDSYRFFDALGDLIRTGPTNTNVNDLYLLFAF